MNAHAIRFLFIVILCACAGCASIVPPSGGPKDVTPPKLLSVTPADSLLNTRVSKIRMVFDEYITVSDASKEVEISPILKIAPTVTGLNKHVNVRIPDTLLEANTTYRISFGKAIKDLHENNPFQHYTYTFSTGSYFDSLQISGTVVNAMTGLPDSSIYILLYSALRPDSAVVREKPKYVVKADVNGSFSMKGLPAREFRIYALKDANENLIYDGIGEMIGFFNEIIIPGKANDPANAPINLKVFPEAIDTNFKKDTFIKKDTSAKKDTGTAANGRVAATQNEPEHAKQTSKKEQKEKEKESKNFSYSVNLDTTNAAKRTHDITLPINVTFNKQPVINMSKITLTYDSDGVNVPVAIADSTDTAKKPVVHILPQSWRENTVYTLRLPKGFAKDTGGTEALPSRYTFRTLRDEDYGKLQVHLPSKYYGKQYILMVMADKDTIYQKPVTDTMVSLIHLKPATYTFRIIHDKNENGKWDTGELFAKKQPEDVIPYIGSQALRAGWENIVDFEQAPPVKKGAPQSSGPPK